MMEVVADHGNKRTYEAASASDDVANDDERQHKQQRLEEVEVATSLESITSAANDSKKDDTGSQELKPLDGEDEKKEAKSDADGKDEKKKGSKRSSTRNRNTCTKNLGAMRSNLFCVACAHHKRCLFSEFFLDKDQWKAYVEDPRLHQPLEAIRNRASSIEQRTLQTEEKLMELILLHYPHWSDDYPRKTRSRMFDNNPSASPMSATSVLLSLPQLLGSAAPAQNGSPFTSPAPERTAAVSSPLVVAALSEPSNGAPISASGSSVSHSETSPERTKQHSDVIYDEGIRLKAQVLATFLKGLPKHQLLPVVTWASRVLRGDVGIDKDLQPMLDDVVSDNSLNSII
eukprot:TRINITY_DN9565_c0_g1_i2.p1 TRINITY_DN9565_c0_g1~~TRINITY_DN9565_c0_g1_i2.p1  ORF type:complete len:344 (-),score=70.47 TRINITY_DN9565_c0_g1_i2:26-1057(-)